MTPPDTAVFDPVDKKLRRVEVVTGEVEITVLTGASLMGRWGPGNFDDDIARDFLVDIVLKFEKLIERILAGDYPEEARGASSLEDAGECCLVPTVEVIIALHERLGSDYLPRRETVARWSRDYLDRLEQILRETDPNILPWYLDERRPVIADTFSRLLRLSEENWKDEGDVDWTISNKSDI